MMGFVNRILSEKIISVDRMQPQIELIDHTKRVLYSTDVKTILQQLSEAKQQVLNVKYQVVEEDPLNSQHFLKKEVVEQNIPLNYTVVDLDDY